MTRLMKLNVLFYRMSLCNVVRLVDELRSYWQSSVMMMTQNVVENLPTDVVSSSVASKSLQSFKKKLEELDKKFAGEQTRRMEKLLSEHDSHAKVTLECTLYIDSFPYLWNID